MIYLRAFRLLDTPDKQKRRLLPVKLGDKKDRNPIKWPNDLNIFDVFDPKMWRLYLANDYRLPNGKMLPHRSEFGELIVYNVYVYGTSREMQEHFGKKSGSSREGGGMFNLFPGYDPKTGEQRKVEKYGWIRR